VRRNGSPFPLFLASWRGKENIAANDYETNPYFLR
jgi:hypothetical protein